MDQCLLGLLGLGGGVSNGEGGLVLLDLLGENAAGTGGEVGMFVLMFTLLHTLVLHACFNVPGPP